MKTLKIIFPDQISKTNLVLSELNNNSLILFYEPLDTFKDIHHHKHKLVFLIASFRKYIKTIKHKNIIHEKISKNSKFDLSIYLKALQEDHNFQKIEITNPSDFDTKKNLMFFCSSLNIELDVKKDTKFIASPHDFNEWAKGKKTRIQEYYYRWLRKKFSILMDGENQPIGGKWNFDKENRLGISKLKTEIPKRIQIKPDQITFEAMVDIEKIFPNSLGDLENFNWATTHTDAEKLLDDFLDRYLHCYGPFQDAINKNNTFMFHSLLSPYLNNGLLSPKLCIDKAIDKYADSKHKIPINSIEGFIRQILGWREFISGVYWENMPDYKNLNFWSHKFKLTNSWYSGTTGIPILDDSIKESTLNAYTHHINRLMIISNLMNLTGIHPSQMYKWFMEMYIDSYDWVMVPNVYGMGSYADGGIFSTKPYICGSSYMLKMSNYPKGEWCETVDGLYWKFIHDNAKFFDSSPRLKIMLNTLNKIKKERKNNIFKKAERFIELNTI